MQQVLRRLKVPTTQNPGRHIYEALLDVAACRQGAFKGYDIEPISRAIILMTLLGPADANLSLLTELVLNVRHGKLSPHGAVLCLFRGD